MSKNSKMPFVTTLVWEDPVATLVRVTVAPSTKVVFDVASTMIPPTAVASVGYIVGVNEGKYVGPGVGSDDGIFVGFGDGETLGATDGAAVGPAVGAAEGARDGVEVGAFVGTEKSS